MNILKPAIIADEFLNRVFDITEEKIAITPGLVYLNFDHDRIKMKFIIDLDLDTGTLVKINDVRVKYHSNHTFDSLDGLFVLIKTILEELGLV